MQLHEKYRPKRLEEVVGQDAAIAQIKAIIGRSGWDRDALWLEGYSGTGKTTIANILANHVCSDPWDIECLKGVDCDVDSVRRIGDLWCLGSRRESGWRACIVDEAHAMSPRAIQAWLTLLEPLRQRRLAVFTSTETVQCDLFGNFTTPFADRCKVIRLEPDLPAIANHVQQIARREGMDGRSKDAYMKLARQCCGSVRAMLQRIEAGDMMRPEAARSKQHMLNPQSSRAAFLNYQQHPTPENLAAWQSTLRKRS